MNGRAMISYLIWLGVGREGKGHTKMNGGMSLAVYMTTFNLKCPNPILLSYGRLFSFRGLSFHVPTVTLVK